MFDWLFPWRKDKPSVHLAIDRKEIDRAMGQQRIISHAAKTQQIESIAALAQRTVFDQVSERGTELQMMVQETLAKARGDKSDGRF